MRINKLRKKLRRQARRELRAGRITQQQADQCEAVAADYWTLRALNSEIERQLGPWYCADFAVMGWKGWFASLWDWFVANWPEILKIILKIAPLLLMEKTREDS